MRLSKPLYYYIPQQTAGFSALELAVALALLVILTGMGFRSWQHYNRSSELKSEIHLTVLRSLQDARQHARTQGNIVGWRFERRALILEINESEFSTRWMTISNMALPDDWQVIDNTHQRLLILPHGRPSDTMEWHLSHPELKHDYWLRLLITGIIEWEPAES